MLYNRNRARQSLIDTVAFRIASQAATVLGYVVLVRGMSREDFGVFNLLYAFIPVFSMVASFGLEQVLRRYQPEYLQAGNLAAASWLVKIVSRGRFATNVVLLALVLLGWGYIAPVFKLTPYRGVFVIFSLLTLLHFQVSILQMALASRMLHRYSVGATALLSWVKLATYGLLMWQGSLTLTNAVLADTLAYGVVYVGAYVAYRRCTKLDGATTPYRPEPAERRRLVRYGLFNSFNDAGVLLLYSTVDNFVIAAVIDTVSVGIYSFYSRLSQMTQNLLPQRLFDNVVQPLLFAVPQAQAVTKIPEYFTFLLNMNLLLQWPVLAFSVVYHQEIVQVIFGGNFLEYSWLLPVVMAFCMLNTIADPVSIIAQYEERAGVILLSKVFAAYNILAMLVLVPSYGIIGAVVASGSAQAMKNLFIWWHVRRSAVWLNALRAMLVGTALWGAAALAGFACKALLPVPPPVQLLVGLVLVAGAMLLHLRGPAVSASDRRILASVMHGRETALLGRLGLMPAAMPEKDVRA